MNELVEVIKQPWTYVVAGLLLFGFAPRLILRLLVLCFPKGDPRRAELLGELDAIPYKDRPIFVAEQLEVALVEGLGGRARSSWYRKITDRWSLQDGLQLNRKAPDTFWMPSADERWTLGPGDIVKLMFNTRSGWSERMWVKIVKRTRNGYVGELDNVPAAIPDLRHTKRVRFQPKHIIDIEYDDSVGEGQGGVK